VVQRGHVSLSRSGTGPSAWVIGQGNTQGLSARSSMGQAQEQEQGQGKGSRVKGQGHTLGQSVGTESG